MKQRSQRVDVWHGTEEAVLELAAEEFLKSIDQYGPDDVLGDEADDRINRWTEPGTGEEIYEYSDTDWGSLAKELVQDWGWEYFLVAPGSDYGYDDEGDPYFETIDY